jgi:DNA repair protein RadC
VKEKSWNDKESKAELVELLLIYGIPRKDVKPLAYDLLKKFGDILGVVSAPKEALCAVPKMTKDAAILLKLVNKITLLRYERRLSDSPILNDDKRLYDYCGLLLMSKKQEEFHALFLDKNQRLLQDYVHAAGLAEKVDVSPQAIVRRAIEAHAKFAILAHNHPDSNDCFSQQDADVTTKIKSMLGPVGVELLDHILICGLGDMYSAKALHLLQ